MWFWHLVESSHIYEGMSGGRERSLLPAWVKDLFDVQELITCVTSHPKERRLLLTPWLGISLMRKSVNSNKYGVMARMIYVAEKEEHQPSPCRVLLSGSNKYKMLWQGPCDPLSDHPEILV